MVIVLCVKNGVRFRRKIPRGGTGLFITPALAYEIEDKISGRARSWDGDARQGGPEFN